MNRIYIVTLIVTLFITATVAYAGNVVELENNLTTGNQSIKLCLSTTDGKVSGFVQVCDSGFAQAYAGPSVKLGSNANGWLGGGFDTNDHFRYGGAVWAGKGKMSFLHLFSGRESGPWHEAWFNVQVSKKIGLGLVENSATGFGSRVEYKLSQDASVRLTLLAKDGQTSSVFATRLAF
jgi:hypothetical protein